MVAVVAFHNVADLTHLQSIGGILEDLHHGIGGEDIAVGVFLPAGVLTVLIRQLGEQCHGILGAAQLCQQILSQSLLFLKLFGGQRLAGIGIDGRQQNVVCVGGVLAVVFRLQIQVGALLQNQQKQIVKQVAGGGEILEGILRDAQLFQIGIEGLLTAQLCDGAVEAV